MYFLILNILLALFFLFLVVVGIILKYRTYIPVNVLGVVVVAVSIYLDNYAFLPSGYIILLLLTLVAIFVANIVFVFRDFAEVISKDEAERRSRYIVEENQKEFFKLIKDKLLIKNELQERAKIPTPETTQAYELMLQGNEAFLQQKYDEALEKYRLSIDWVKSAVGYLNLSGTFLKLGKFNEALASAKKATTISPNLFEAYFNQAIAYEKMGKVEQAVPNYRAAVKISPRDHELWFCYAEVMFKMKKFKDAVECYEKSLDLNENQFGGWYNKGICLQKTGNEIEALKAFEQAKQLRPKYAKVHFRMANILSNLNRDEQAVKHYKKAIKINGESGEMWNSFGIALNKLGRKKNALKCFERAILLQPNSHEAWLNKGLTLEAMGSEKKVYAVFKKYLEIAPIDFEKQRNFVQSRLVEIGKKYKIKSRKGNKERIKIPK